MRSLSIAALMWSTYAAATIRLETQPSSCVLNYTSIIPKRIETSISDDYGRFMQTVGSGSSATVSTYRRYTDNKTVSVKKYTLPSYTDDEIQEIKLEYQLGALVSNISFMPSTLDLLHEPSTCQWYLVTDYIPHSLMDLRLALGPQELVDILLSLEVGIHAMHNLGISHGDIKLENVLLAAGHNPILIDFGSSTFHYCRIDTSGVETNVAPGDYGTPAYLPPEVFLSLEYDRAKADLWALGVLAHALFARRMPWGLASLKDSRWREVLGVDLADGDCCMTSGSALAHHMCTSGMARVISEVPKIIRDAVASWLEVDPVYRSYSG